MVVVDGVRYRPEHAPRQQPVKEPEAKQSPEPKNKSRAPRDKQ